MKKTIKKNHIFLRLKNSILSFLLIVWTERNKQIRKRELIESILLLSISFLLGQIVFFRWFEESFSFLSKNYLLFGFILWIALRLGIRAVLIALLLIFIQISASKSTSIDEWIYLFTLFIFAGTTAIYITHIKQGIENLQLKDSALQAAANGILITNRKGFIEWANKAFSDLTGYSMNEIYTLNPREIMRSGKQDDEFYKTMWNTILSKKVWHGELVNRRKDGSFYDEEMTITPVINLEGEITHFIAVKQDITKRKQAEAELRIAATVFDAQEGMMITDASSIILKVNHAFTRITGYKPEEVIGKSPSIFRSGRHDEAFYATMWKSIHQTKAWQGEVWNRRKSGEIYPQWLTITAVVGGNNIINRYVATLTDITERKATEEFINRLAFYDPLTQLPNRRLLEERLKHGITVNRRNDTQMAALMLDLDKFKAVNDKYGHSAGDDLLQQVALRIKSRLREVDLVSRLGGDEFFILIEDIRQIEIVANIAEDIVFLLSQPFTVLESYTVEIGGSVGICLYPDNGDNPSKLMKNADLALYHAKEQGRGRYAFFTDDLLLKKQETILDGMIQ
ncbi:MAG: diguanylate cyclase [Leptospiraceae bacterium]|nr:diguanylate cyclase [Leptospiraceae bacterium]MBK9500737.1 diguanylate cyclase [Leptospiraceae bacterium]MBP9164703.1 diguanylate cyclase [Leptospiraceae bacterium]